MLLPNMVLFLKLTEPAYVLRLSFAAESRGPGVKNHFDESGDDYDMDLDSRTRSMSGRQGRIILLGDGSEVLTESDDTEMFDHDEEDKDLDSQVSKGHPGVEDSNSRPRGDREETPGPQPQKSDKGEDSASITSHETTTSGSSVSTASSETKIIPESALPEKLVSPAQT